LNPPAKSDHSGAAVDVSPRALLDAFVEASDDALISHDIDGMITSWSHTAERLFGYRSTEILGKHSTLLFPKHSRDAIRELFDTVMAGDRVSHFETDVLRKDGMPLPISLSLCPVFEGGGAPVASVLVARDITEQRLAQAALGEVDARVREGEAMAHVGSWLWDLRTGAVQWSDEFHRIHGIDPLDFDGTLEAHLRCIHVDDRERVRAAIEDSVAKDRPFEEAYRIVRPDKETRSVHARAQTAMGSAGTVVGLRGIGQDVTDRQGSDGEAS